MLTHTCALYAMVIILNENGVWINQTTHICSFKLPFALTASSATHASQFQANVQRIHFKMWTYTFISVCNAITVSNLMSPTC